MPDVTWDDTFEASPADTDEAKYGAAKIRQLKLAVRERGELELNWKAGTQPFAKAGKIAVMFAGTTAEINALTGMAAGAFAWDTSLNVIKRYNGSAWVIITPDHGNLAGLGDDDHTQYLHLNKAGQTLQQNLAVADGVTIDGVDLSAKIPSLVALKFLTTPVNKISWTAATDWTDVDISADTGSDTAKAAYLSVELSFGNPYGGSGTSVMTGLFRKNGSTETAKLPKIRNSVHSTASGQADESWNAGVIIVECDASEIFETKLELTHGVTPNGITYKVDLIGYFA
jgi:hypothetical protein